jgi:hypothetical protein
VDDGDSTDAQYCGYAWLRLECRRDEPMLQLPSGDYAIAEIHYGERTMRLDDVAVNSTSSAHTWPAGPWPSRRSSRSRPAMA